MTYILTAGYIRKSERTKNKVIELTEKGNDGKGIGIDKILPKSINLEKLDSKMSDVEKADIFNKYNELCEKYFRPIDIKETPWLTHPKINSHRGSPYREITSEFIEEMKESIKSSRDFFRAIKDEYVDNDTRPNEEVCIIDTPSLRRSLKRMASEVLDEDRDIDVKYIDFIKWAYWYFTNCLNKKGKYASIRMQKI